MGLLGLVALIVGTVLVIACGSGSSDKTATSQPAASSPARATAPAAAATGGGRALNVSARDFLFDPNKPSAKKGQTVTINFKNDGSTSHTFTLYTDEDHTKAVANGDSGMVAAGGSKTLTVAIAADSGDLYFRCEIHPTQMMGEISVD